MLLFIHGSDTYRARKKVRLITQRYESRYPGAFELHELDWSENPDAEVLLRTLQSGGFFAAHKLVVVKDFFQAPLAFVERIHAYLRDVDLPKQKGVTLLFWECGDIQKEGALKAAFSWLRRNALTEEYVPLTGEAFRRWVKRQLRDQGIALALRPFADFCRMFEGDTWRAALEIEKLALGHPLVLPEKRAGEIFQLVRALWRHDQKKALGLLDALLAEGLNEFYILAMMAYAVRKSLGNLKDVPAPSASEGTERLKNLHEAIAEADLKIKTGARETRLALELLAVKLTSRQQRVPRLS